MESRWCFAEITQARGLGKPILPIKIEPCKVDALLTRVQIIDLIDPAAGWDEAYQRLQNGLIRAGLDPNDIFDWDSTRSPYPGLLTFQEQDAAILFGREKEIGQGLELLRHVQSFPGHRLVMVLGASGSGKSSLVRAGILPRLKRDPHRWLVLDPFRPQDRPFEKLGDVIAEAFKRLSKENDWKANPIKIAEKLGHSDADFSAGLPLFWQLIEDLRNITGRREATVLLTIDQFEELLVEGMNHLPSRFIGFLRSIERISQGQLIILGTLRSDFLATFQEHPATKDLRFKDLKLGPMLIEGLAQVIEGPARIAKLKLEDGLVQAMIDDTKTAHALPLLAFTLSELYEKHGKDDRTLTIEEYRDKLGGLEGSINRVAEGLFAGRLPSDEQAEKIEHDIRSAFLSMVRVNEKGQHTKQPARWQHMPLVIHGTLERFVQARLLVSDGDGKDRVLEVAHEALFRVWSRLSKWLDEGKAFLLWRRRFEEASKEWELKPDDEELLLRPGQLAEAENWLSRHSINLISLQQAFLRKSKEQIEREMTIERRRQEREKRRQKRITIAACVTALIFSIVAWAAGSQWIRAKAELATNYWSKAMNAKLNDDRLSALHFFAKSAKEMPAHSAAKILRLAESSSIELLKSRLSNSLLDIQSYSNGSILVHLFKSQGSISNVEMSEDGSEVLAWSHNDGVQLWRPKDGTPIASLKHDGQIQGVAFFKNGDRILTWSDDRTARLWHAQDGTPVGSPLKHDGPVTGAVFSEDEQQILTWGQDGTARLWQVRDGTPIGSTMKHDGPVYGAKFTKDEQRILTWSEDRTARLWYARDGASAGLVIKNIWSLNGAMFDEEEQRILTWDGIVPAARLWQAQDGTPIGPPLEHEDGAVNGARFNKMESEF